MIEEGIAKGEFWQKDPKLISLFILGFLNSINVWFKPNGLLSPEEIASKAYEFISQLLLAQNRSSPESISKNLRIMRNL